MRLWKRQNISEKVTETSFESQFVFKALCLPPMGEGPVSFSDICTDSRKTVPGCLFVPLKGDRFDAHDFIVPALESGATGTFCNRSYPEAEQVRKVASARKAVVFFVENTFQ